MILRDYQLGAVDSVFKEWEENQSTLGVAATGLGKTQIFCEVIRRRLPERALILVHREELAFQAWERLKKFGIDAEVEMADLKASTTFWNRSPCIISTIQTQIAGNDGKGRMARFDPSTFSTLVIDEGHHATADTYRRVMAYYKQNPRLKLLGVTATPDRTDEQALGQIFESVAFDIEIMDGIQGGWLCPIRQQLVEIEGLDYSTVRTTAGDLNGADVAAIVEAEKMLQGFASATLQIIGERKTLVFTATVRQAEMMCDIFNRHRANMAKWICGKTAKDLRRSDLESFSKGETQIMVNCGVLTEGYDENSIKCIVQAKPTKSRCLYSQMIGRATRPLAGLVDGLETAEERKQAIAASDKPSMLVIDFVGNSGRHKLITSADILGGKYQDEEVELAERNAKEKGGDVDMAEELEKARLEIEERKRREAARKAGIKLKASFSSVEINPFAILEITPERERGWDAGKKTSERQDDWIRSSGIDPDKYSYHQKKQIIRKLAERSGKNLATIKMVMILKKRGYQNSESMTFDEARNAINEIAAKEGWKKK